MTCKSIRGVEACLQCMNVKVSQREFNQWHANKAHTCLKLVSLARSLHALVSTMADQESRV